MTMTNFANSELNATIRTLDDSELDFVVGGIIDGCIPNRPITIFTPPQPTPPWFDPQWVLVGKTGTVPR
jgi:hypothetical protein